MTTIESPRSWRRSTRPRETRQARDARRTAVDEIHAAGPGGDSQSGLAASAERILAAGSGAPRRGGAARGLAGAARDDAGRADEGEFRLPVGAHAGWPGNA